jgi:hypothetical protein
VGFFKKFKHPKATLTLGVDKNQLYFGDQIKGIATLKCDEELEIEHINASLSCVESIKKTRRYQETIRVGTNQRTLEPINKTVWREEEYYDRANLYSDHVQLCGLLPTIIGLSTDFSLTFKMPLSGRETYHSVESNVRWSVSAFAKVKGRMNIPSKGGGEILVSKPIIAPPITIKEVVKEVVLIPCSYCSGLMPQTSIFCPNCGARRKS